MDSDFLFQNFEGVLSLTKRKAKILTFLSLAGLLIAVVLTVIFAFNIDNSKYIPGVIVLGCMLVLNIIFLLQGNYNSAVRVIYILPLAVYFLYITNYYAISIDEEALKGILRMLYFGILYLFVFSFSVKVIFLFVAESMIVVVYYLMVQNNLASIFTFQSPTILSIGNPILELLFVGTLQTLFYSFYNNLINSTSSENYTIQSRLGESFRQIEHGILILQVQRDLHGEKSGMIIKRTNLAFDKTFKVTREEVVGAQFSDIFPKIFRDSFNWQEVFFHSPQSRLQVKINHLDKWFIISNVFPEPDVIIASFVNITALKQETKRLQIREERLTSLMGSLPDIFFIIEKDGTYIDYVSNNPELMKIGQKDIIGKTIFEMGFSKPMSYQIYSSIQHVLENDNIETIEYGMELPTGKTIMFEMRLARLNDSQIISIGRDVTAKKEYQQELIAARRKTEEASRLKASFIENISHEMRTPMNAIIGFSNLAINKKFSIDEQGKFLNIVIENGEDLMNIVTNVIDISEIETGSISVKMHACKINESLEKIFHKHKNAIQKSNLNIELALELGENSHSLEIYTDNHLFSKIINHLVENAIKFTKEGKVTFGYK
ncbi:MAG: PAS domain S-box protein, partial [Prolixibacteraceae bacterium]|nr:PAS domain S-box protein [Prolixibacteraceae bacterium]